ncbi:class I SAM-dependent methyltransferase [Rugosimonospora africana]|uniref:Methyltransferase type 11 n=1 Tax=Rugosimonospora africana TaxID=556532 RepID=A0A8J3VP66_9ACTN|nr:class I SAM-dependent methyltransferase [Rugosimonospora africana]GIH13839.1 methyltransferase type 11 [Rugosimonospora africana]
MASTETKRFKLVPEMEGVTARWYARQRGSASQLALVREQAARITEGLPAGADILEVAPGPGYQAVELARLGYRVTALDVSHTMVDIAREYARKETVDVDVRQGDAAAMPFEAESFDRIVCQAAFKNFERPVLALDEMHRVLRAGGTALIQDLPGDATGADIDREVRQMQASGVSALVVRLVLRGLRRRAFSRSQFEELVAASAFRTGEIRVDGVNIEVRLTRAATA